MDAAVLAPCVARVSASMLLASRIMIRVNVWCMYFIVSLVSVTGPIFSLYTQLKSLLTEWIKNYAGLPSAVKSDLSTWYNTLCGIMVQHHSFKVILRNMGYVIHVIQYLRRVQFMATTMHNVVTLLTLRLTTIKTGSVRDFPRSREPCFIVFVGVI